MTSYLDCNATTPMDPRVYEVVSEHLLHAFGNAGSRTHALGTEAKRAVGVARDQVAQALGARRDEVLFTSGATESNNLALLGLAEHGREIGRTHIISTAIEHKAVLEPLEHLANTGFEVTWLTPTPGGWVAPEAVAEALRPETLLVSVMAANNETGIVQPLEAIADALGDHPAYLHTDAAQSFGKGTAPLRLSRVDLVSVSGHKIYGPKGVGALVVRRRGFERPPLRPLMWGGGQERGLRPGTLPVPLIVGLGLAAELAAAEETERREQCLAFRRRALDALISLEPVFHGDLERCQAHVLNLSVPGLDSEAAMLALKPWLAISNGSACTSQAYTPSHVLQAMGLSEAEVAGALRLSWCHATEEPDWGQVVAALRGLRSSPILPTTPAR